MTRKGKPNDNPSMSPVLGVPVRGVIPPRVFRSRYPLCYALGLKPVSVAGNTHEGYDIDEVEKKLGTDRFKSLMATLKHVFCCGHRIWPKDHPEPHKGSCEVHCVYARDLETFLKGTEIPGKGN